MKPKVLVICGPTASGKTALSVACAKALGTEIISADSLLVYKGLNIGTAKPTEEERGGIPHHLIDVAEPTESFSVSDYESLAFPILQNLLDQGKIPVVCGGTGFYIQALLYKSQFGGAGADEKVREKYENILSEKGSAFLHDLLQEKDPESAAVLHQNDTKRVIRALEIFDVTGKKKSEQQDKPVPRFDFVSVSIDYPREILYDRINLRVENMFEEGLKEEVSSLLSKGVTKDSQCMQGIGYKEMLEGVSLGMSDEEIKEWIKKNTRNYAKRQLTFFKRMQNHTFLAPEQANADYVLTLI
jgi:tRNA dimethylallyltransferase